MSGIELNKICAAVLLAGIIAMVTGSLSGALYHPDKNPEKRGYSIEGADEAGTAGTTAATNAPVDILSYMATADVVAGEASSKKCTSCHSFEKGGASKTGPNLWNVLGGPVGHSADFTYSLALQGMKGKKWGFNEMSEFLANPKKYAPGTRMGFAGIRKPEERANLIAYLRSLSDSPIAVPAAAPKAAPEAKNAPETPKTEE